MNAYPDTSFLFSLYTLRTSSDQATAIFGALEEPLPVTTLLLYEFENSVRRTAWLYKYDKKIGIAPDAAQVAMARMENDIELGFLSLVPFDLPGVLEIGRRISSIQTWRGGYRSFDILHVATALQLGAKSLLTFDLQQRELAMNEGLKIVP